LSLVMTVAGSVLIVRVDSIPDGENISDPVCVERTNTGEEGRLYVLDSLATKLANLASFT
jgi:hypothetical protein